MNVMERSNRRLTLFEQMSAVDNSRTSLAGLTLDAVLGTVKNRHDTPPSANQNRTLIDIIRDDGTTKDKKSWKMFRDKLRLKRAGAAWTSSVPIPASDVNDRATRSQRRASDGGDPSVANSRTQLGRRSSVRFAIQGDTDGDDASMPPPSRSFRPQFVRNQSTRFPSEEDDAGDDDSPDSREGSRQLGAALAEERQLSAREAVAAQEAAEAAAAAAVAAEQADAAQAAAEHNESPPGAAEEPVKMSLMDLLDLSGSSYTMGDDDEEEYYDEDEEEEEEEASGGIEYTCCVCMVRHKGSAFIPCGHTFCRLCSRELFVQRGNCPLCNGFILEILDIF